MPHQFDFWPEGPLASLTFIIISRRLGTATWHSIGMEGPIFVKLNKYVLKNNVG